MGILGPAAREGVRGGQTLLEEAMAAIDGAGPTRGGRGGPSSDRTRPHRSTSFSALSRSPAAVRAVVTGPRETGDYFKPTASFMSAWRKKRAAVRRRSLVATFMEETEGELQQQPISPTHSRASSPRRHSSGGRMVREAHGSVYSAAKPHPEGTPVEAGWFEMLLALCIVKALQWRRGMVRDALDFVNSDVKGLSPQKPQEAVAEYRQSLSSGSAVRERLGDVMISARAADPVVPHLGAAYCPPPYTSPTHAQHVGGGPYLPGHSSQANSGMMYPGLQGSTPHTQQAVHYSGLPPSLDQANSHMHYPAHTSAADIVPGGESPSGIGGGYSSYAHPPPKSHPQNPWSPQPLIAQPLYSLSPEGDIFPGDGYLAHTSLRSVGGGSGGGFSAGSQPITGVAYSNPPGPPIYQPQAPAGVPHRQPASQQVKSVLQNLHNLMAEMKVQEEVIEKGRRQRGS
eukprot:gene9051-16174_t